MHARVCSYLIYFSGKNPGSGTGLCMYMYKNTMYSVHVFSVFFDILQETECDQKKADRHSLLKACKVCNCGQSIWPNKTI